MKHLMGGISKHISVRGIIVLGTPDMIIKQKDEMYIGEIISHFWIGK